MYQDVFAEGSYVGQGDLRRRRVPPGHRRAVSREPHPEPRPGGKRLRPLGAGDRRGAVRGSPRQLRRRDEPPPPLDPRRLADRRLAPAARARAGREAAAQHAPGAVPVEDTRQPAAQPRSAGAAAAAGRRLDADARAGGTVDAVRARAARRPDIVRGAPGAGPETPRTPLGRAPAMPRRGRWGASSRTPGWRLSRCRTGRSSTCTRSWSRACGCSSRGAVCWCGTRRAMRSATRPPRSASTCGKRGSRRCAVPPAGRAGAGAPGGAGLQRAGPGVVAARAVRRVVDQPTPRARGARAVGAPVDVPGRAGPPDVALLRGAGQRGAALAAAGQLPGSPRTRRRLAHLADQHRAGAARQPGGARLRLPSRRPAAGADRTTPSRRWKGWSATAAISTTGTTRDTLRPLRPFYVSSVDSGNLVGALFTLRAGLEELKHQPLVSDRLCAGLADTLHVVQDHARGFPALLTGCSGRRRSSTPRAT